VGGQVRGGRRKNVALWVLQVVAGAAVLGAGAATVAALFTQSNN